jgi:hypothetical protein
MLNAKTIKHWLITNIKGRDSAEIIRQHMM